MKRILLSLGAMAAVAAPVAVAVSCNDDTETTKNEFQKIAEAAKSTTKLHPELSPEFNTVIVSLPKDFGMSTPEQLNKIEADVRTHFGIGNGGAHFQVGTYKSAGSTADDHIELTYNDGLTDAQMDAKMNEIIDFIATMK